MRKVFLMLMIVVVAGSAFVFGSSAENISVRGDYVEVRTASVFAGACHYNGEVVTTGREAMMAWNITSGKWQGNDLTNVRVLAIVSSASNLGDKNAARKSEIVIDSSSRSQSLAVLDAIKQKYAASLGEVIKVRNAPVKFVHEDKSYAVAADDATIAVEAMPNDLCCKMPNLVWYTPLVGLENRKVGYTANAAYSGDSVGEQWSRAGENSAFYGSFSF